MKVSDGVHEVSQQGQEGSVVYQSVKVKLGAVESTLTITKIMIGTKQPESGLAA